MLAFLSSVVIWSLFNVSCAALKRNTDLLVIYFSKKLKQTSKHLGGGCVTRMETLTFSEHQQISGRFPEGTLQRLVHHLGAFSRPS